MRQASSDAAAFFAKRHTESESLPVSFFSQLNVNRRSADHPLLAPPRQIDKPARLADCSAIGLEPFECLYDDIRIELRRQVTGFPTKIKGEIAQDDLGDIDLCSLKLVRLSFALFH